MSLHIVFALIWRKFEFGKNWNTSKIENTLACFACSPAAHLLISRMSARAKKQIMRCTNTNITGVVAKKVKRQQKVFQPFSGATSKLCHHWSHLEVDVVQQTGASSEEMVLQVPTYLPSAVPGTFQVVSWLTLVTMLQFGLDDTVFVIFYCC